MVKKCLLNLTWLQSPKGAVILFFDLTLFLPFFEENLNCTSGLVGSGLALLARSPGFESG